MTKWMAGAGVCVLVAILAGGAVAASVEIGAPTRPADVNLALNKPVKVSGESQGDMVPAKAVDGVATNDSGWHCGSSPARLEVDLQKVHPIDRAKVFLYYDGVRFYQYTVEASADGKTWKKVVDMSTNTKRSAADGDEHHFKSTEARYVRVNLLKNSANPGVHLNEIMVFEADKAVGPLDLQSRGYIDFGDGAGTLTFADSSRNKWDLTKTLTILKWTKDKDKVFIGKGKTGLTKEQLARIGFAEPFGKEPGVLYAAGILDDGQVVPGARVQAVNPPFDLSEKARAERQKLYAVAGRDNLTGKNTPLKKGMVISFYGDSITWLNVYVAMIDQALKKGEGTKGLDVKLINHGINGGGVLSIRDGEGKDIKPFAPTVAAEKADVAVIYIGINDIWWRNTAPEVFEKALTDIVAQARASKTVPVLATLSVWGDSPDPKAWDPKCEQYAQITRKVAAATGVTLVDLRRAFIAYLQNNNYELQLDGTLTFADSGVVTYDRVHPSQQGNELLADLIAQGIYEALKK